MAKPGKYDHIIGDLKPAPPQDVPYQQRVDEVKLTLEPLDTTDLAKEYIGLRNGRGRVVDVLFLRFKDGLDVTPEEELTILVEALGKDGIEALEKACNLRIEAATQLLVKRQDEGVGGWGDYGVKDNALRLENGMTIRVQSEPYGQVKDKEAFRLWCIAPADVCRTCGEPEHVPQHPIDHMFNPGGGMERQLQLWPSTMNAIAKERCVNGDPYPDGIEVFRKDIVKLVAPGGKD